jgi:hypothetical protein
MGTTYLWIKICLPSSCSPPPSKFFWQSSSLTTSRWSWWWGHAVEEENQLTGFLIIFGFPKAWTGSQI